MCHRTADCGQVVTVEWSRQPFDRARKEDPVRHGGTVGADQIDLGIELAIPPATDRFHVRPGEPPRQRGHLEGLADERFDGGAPPRGPSPFDEAESRAWASTAGLFVHHAQHPQPSRSASHDAVRHLGCKAG
jgi:hypothetical protein